MFKKVLLILALGVLCGGPAMAKPRPMIGSEQHKTQEAYNVSAFHTLRVEGQIEVELEQVSTEAYTVSFTGPYNLAEQAAITNEEGILSIRYSKPLSVLGDQHLRVFVTVPDLTQIEAHGGAEIHTHSALNVKKLNITVDGKSEVELDQLQVQFLTATVGGEAEVDIRELICQTLQAKARRNGSFDAQRTDCGEVFIEAANRAEISISGLNGKMIIAESRDAAEMELKGRVEKASLTARGHSEIDATGLQAENANVTAGRSSHIGVRVAGTLDAQAENRAVVEYKGRPQQINRTGKGIVKQN